jgi:transcriptional regulator with GAF, ATPase, and Fis domain
MNDPDEDESSTIRREDFLPLDVVNARHIRQALKICKGKIHGHGGAAALLGLNPSTLRYRMRKLGIPSGSGKR